jgi:hypothetical protein
MATIKQLFSVLTTSPALDFRNNDKPDSKGVTWANAWVTGKDDKLYCIGASVATITKIMANLDMDIMATKPVDMVGEKSGKVYRLMQIGIPEKPVDFSIPLV